MILLINLQSSGQQGSLSISCLCSEYVETGAYELSYTSPALVWLVKGLVWEMMAEGSQPLWQSFSFVLYLDPCWHHHAGCRQVRAADGMNAQPTGAAWSCMKRMERSWPRYHPAGHNVGSTVTAEANPAVGRWALPAGGQFGSKPLWGQERALLWLLC